MKATSPVPPGTPARRTVPPPPTDVQAERELAFFDASPATDDAPELDQSALFQLQRDRLLEELYDIRSDRSFREVYAPRIYRLIYVWLTGVFALMLLSGLDPVPFSLSDTVAIAMIGGTTASVLGLLVIVITYIFPRRGRPRR